MEVKAMDSLLDELFETDEPKIEENRYQVLACKYKEMFGHAVPVYLLPENISTHKMCEMLNVCISTGKDCLLEQANVQIYKDVIY